MEDRLSVRIAIADRIYPLKIAVENEEKLRKAAKMINDEISQYKDFTDRDTQDKLAVTALRFVVKFLDKEENKVLTELENRLTELDNELESYLDNKALLI